MQKGKEAKEKVIHEFSNVSLEQLNWKHSPVSWSIAQCLEHLIIADSAYFPDLKNITEGNFKMDLWEKFSPFTRLCGRLMKDSLQEQVKRKMIAPKKIQPQKPDKSLSIIDDYCKNLETFLTLISNCKNVDIDKTIITSPTIKIVTYNLRDAFTFLVQHEHRHINQAIRVKGNDGFPAK
ncbi:MAG TPA: DinB family protein [Chitinophagaceae bacterium]|nr:DinB family protein [Chitinophagaceae bacterium]